ncbi:MAG: DNA oxidative demethylase AlkB [Steroidobacteraceae bacterium]
MNAALIGLGAHSMEPATHRSDAGHLAPGVSLLCGLTVAAAPDLFAAMAHVAALAPFRHQQTPGGLLMSVAMTSCGDFGWVSDRRGYRYEAVDPNTGRPWPAMPAVFAEIAARAASRGGFDGFVADSCLINRYAAGARMSLHQDKDERDFAAPIVSVSLGLPAVFLLGGESRKDRPLRVPLVHGDVLVWGGPARLRYHGVMPVKAGVHGLAGPYRVNLTFRRAS